jgi:hypothetical protein
MNYRSNDKKRAPAALRKTRGQYGQHKRDRSRREQAGLKNRLRSKREMDAGIRYDPAPSELCGQKRLE